MREFLSDGNKVKVTLKYRGRENAHKDLGFEVMQQVIKDMEDAATCEQPPKLLGGGRPGGLLPFLPKMQAP